MLSLVSLKQYSRSVIHGKTLIHYCCLHKLNKTRLSRTKVLLCVTLGVYYFRTSDFFGGVPNIFSNLGNLASSQPQFYIHKRPEFFVIFDNMVERQMHSACHFQDLPISITIQLFLHSDVQIHVHRYSAYILTSI